MGFFLFYLFLRQFYPITATCENELSFVIQFLSHKKTFLPANASHHTTPQYKWATPCPITTILSILRSNLQRENGSA